jgi:hypothetical protein
LVINVFIVTTTVTAWFMTGAWILALLNLVPVQGTMNLCAMALWLIVRVVAPTACILFTIAFCYALMAHHHRSPRNILLLLPKVARNRWLRFLSLAITMPFALILTTSTHPYALGLSTTVVVAVATTLLATRAIQETVRTFIIVTSTPRFPHASTRASGNGINTAFRYNNDWEPPHLIRSVGIRQLYSDAARFSAHLRRVFGAFIGLVTTAVIIRVWLWSWHEEPNPLTTLPVLAILAAWLVGNWLYKSSEAYDELSKSYLEAALVQAPNPIRESRGHRFSQNIRRLGKMRSTY